MARAQTKKLVWWLLDHTSDGFYVRFRHYLPLLKGRWPGILHIRRPRSITEKIQYLKINIERLIPDAHIYADKLAVRDYVADTVGQQHLIPLFGSWERAEHIDWTALPDQFVIKANHGSSFNIIVKDKAQLDTAAASTQLNQWLATDYSQRSRENHYRNVSPRLLAEAYLDSGDESLLEYRFRCFDGKCEIVSVNVDQPSNRWYRSPKRWPHRSFTSGSICTQSRDRSTSANSRSSQTVAPFRTHHPNGTGRSGISSTYRGNNSPQI